MGRRAFCGLRSPPAGGIERRLEMTDRWVGLDLRHLLTLRAIADEGSFKAAARALGYTPSAVSQQIASLERVVGTQLIAREHGRQAFGLTEAGGGAPRHQPGRQRCVRA